MGAKPIPHADIVEMANSGLTTRQASEKYGWSYSAVKRRLREYRNEPPGAGGRPKGTTTIPEETIELVRKLRKEQMSYREIAKIAKINPNTAAKYCRDLSQASKRCQAPRRIEPKREQQPVFISHATKEKIINDYRLRDSVEDISEFHGIDIDEVREIVRGIVPYSEETAKQVRRRKQMEMGSSATQKREKDLLDWGILI